jgi:hypothetical protein
MKTNYFFHVTTAVKFFRSCGTRKVSQKPSKNVIACFFSETEKATTIYQEFKKCCSHLLEVSVGVTARNLLLAVLSMLDRRSPVASTPLEVNEKPIARTPLNHNTTQNRHH